MNNVNDVISAGAERVAVVRALMQAEQPTLVTQYFLPSYCIQSPGTLKHLMFNQITLQVNGEPRTCSDGSRLPDLLEQLGFNPAWWQ